MRYGTKAVYNEPDQFGAVVPPIYMVSTYRQTDPEIKDKYVYTRLGNPTIERLEKKLAILEEGKYAIATSSGMAAIDTVFKLLKPGDEIITIETLYATTINLLKTVYNQYGVKVKFVDLTKIEELKREVNRSTKMIYFETPTNPLLKIVDIKEVCDVSKEINENVIVVVDNTFASPYNQRPLTLGADIVVHSTTKYIGGHSDLIGGAIITSNEETYQKLRSNIINSGGIPSPFDAWLILRSLRTFHIRMERHNYNAMKIAEYLSKNEKVERVYYPGLKEHEGHEIAKKQMRTPYGNEGYGGMISFQLKMDMNSIKKFLKNLKIINLAVSLGGVESLIVHPASMPPYKPLTREERERMGVWDNLIRFSVGIEDVEDLIEDLEESLKNT
ncbi:MAG: aminotransferase class I/II-fold pyridoxal phosphate-dependent enzyme [Candidatus Methanomethylicia archaeon]